MNNHKKIKMLSIVLLGYGLMTTAAQGEEYHYYNNEGVMVYGSGYGGEGKIVAQYPEIDRNDLRPVAKISDDKQHITGFIDDDVVSDTKEEYQWVTDGHHILWRGKIVNNPPGTPAVDIDSFRSLGNFAIDKYSLYFDGQRTEGNSGASKVDEATLRTVEGNYATLIDRNNLYLLGRRQTSSNHFTVLHSKLWGNIPRLYLQNKSNYSRDLLIRSQQSVFINGKRIEDIDADTLHIIRWIPNSLLVYRDKNGEHRLPFGRLAGKKIAATNEDSFDIGEKSVRWRKQLSRTPEWSSWQDIPDIDPEQFHLITNRIAQYQDRLFIARLSTFGEDKLDVIQLDSANLVIDGIFNGGKQHIYFIHDGRWSQDVQVVPTSGPLMTTPDFAYDERYVYTWINSSLHKTESPCPAQTVIRDLKIIVATNISECHSKT